MENNIPKVGDIIYLETELYLSHGEDDIVGGKTRVIKVEQASGIIEVVPELCPDTRYNWAFLAEKQESLKAEFGDSWAYKNPDYRPQFNQW